MSCFQHTYFGKESPYQVKTFILLNKISKEKELEQKFIDFEDFPLRELIPPVMISFVNGNQWVFFLWVMVVAWRWMDYSLAPLM